MYSYSLTATTDIETPIVKEENLTRQQMVDRMQAMRAMSRLDNQTYIMAITHESDNNGGNFVWCYFICNGVEDKTLVRPTYYGYWRKKVPCIEGSTLFFLC